MLMQPLLKHHKTLPLLPKSSSINIPCIQRATKVSKKISYEFKKFIA